MRNMWKLGAFSHWYYENGMGDEFMEYCMSCIEGLKREYIANGYLKDLCGFYGFSFIDNSKITDDFLHYDEIHLNKVGSFLLGQNFVDHFSGME